MQSLFATPEASKSSLSIDALLAGKEERVLRVPFDMMFEAAIAAFNKKDYMHILVSMYIYTYIHRCMHAYTYMDV